MAVEKLPSGPLAGDGSGPPAHQFLPPMSSGWTGIALMEWEIRGEAWTDQHPFDEINYVLEGELSVTSDGITVVAGPGEAVRVSAGSVGRYWTSGYARSLGIYLPNPDGRESAYLGYERLDDGQADGVVADP